MRVEGEQQDIGVSDLAVRLEALEKRIERLEKGVRARANLASLQTKPVLIVPETLDQEKDLALFGGTLIGIGGGFLLRALMESHFLPSLAGVALGVAYAFVWLWLADRHARRGQTHAAIFDAVVMAAVVFPLSWEVSVRFDVIPVAAALLLMLVSAGALLLVAWRRNAVAFAWIAALASVPCSAALALGDLRVAAALVSLTLVGSAIWLAARDRKWTGVELVVPAALTMMSAVGAMVANDAHGKDTPDLVALALCVSFLLYTGVVTVRTLRTGTDLTRFDLLALTPPAVVMITGSAWLASRYPSALPAVPLLFGIAAVGAYVLALRNCAALRTACVAFAAMGFLCAIASSAVVLTPSGAGILWSLLAVAFAATAIPDLMLHSSLYAFVAVAASGLLMKSVTLISGIGGSVQLRITDVVIITIVTAAALVSLMRREAQETAITHAARVAVLALTVFIAAAGAARALVALIARDAASAATARSAAIAALAVAMVFVARLPRFRELSALVYPLLCVGAAKFVTDDFIGGRAATLFATLAIYGMALLVVAKFRRSGAATTPRGSPAT